MSFAEVLRQTRFLLLDGALGTELARRGVSVESPLWSANAVLHHPQAVIDIHSDYIRAGADIITTATFRTDTLTFLSAGFPASQAEETTLRAVELARMAIANSTAERDVWIAGSIAPLADCYQPQAAPDFATALNFHRQRARWLASGGVDFCLLETMNNGMEARAATIAALETGLPVFTSFILNEQGALLSGEEIFPVVNQIVKLGVTGVGINCSHHSLITDFLNKFADRISLPLIVYPNAGVYSTKTGWRSDPEFTPSNYTVIADGWLKKGVKIVGGCCNTTPEYIRAITDLKKSPV